MNNSNEPMKVTSDAVLVNLHANGEMGASRVFPVHTPVLGLRVGAPVLLQMRPDVNRTHNILFMLKNKK